MRFINIVPLIKSLPTTNKNSNTESPYLKKKREIDEMIAK